MFNLYENIQTLCEERNITVSAMCEAVKISKSTLSNLKNGRSATITATTAAKIAEFFGTSVNEVLHGQKETPAAQGGGLNDEQLELMRIFDELDTAGRAALLADANALAAARKSLGEL